MSELDKYFEKAKNVEPIYEEDDAKKLLYGKLSDGGIATNLYNKIKVFPMITAIITSVATIATIAFFSLSSPEVRVDQPSKIILQNSNTSAEIDTPENKPTQTKSIISALQTEQKDIVNKKPVTTITDENRIDIKSVNSLKLTKDELSKLGIEIDAKSFKINAFDKYTYTINQNNEKQRDYYNKDKDHDALPTPAMVTTSTGFKTLTLFKKGNVEATVERYKSTDNGLSKYKTNFEQNIKTDDADIDLKVEKIENDSKEVSSNSDLNYVVDGDTVSVKYAKKTDTSERSLEIRLPEGYSKIKDLDSHKERLDGLVNSLDDNELASLFREDKPSKKKDTLIAKIDLGYVNSEFFDKSFDVVEELVNALSNNPDVPYILNHINRIRSINVKYQDYVVAFDFQQIIDKDSHKYDFDKYDTRALFDKKLDSTKFGDPNYYKTFQVSWWGYPDFFDEKDDEIKIIEGSVITSDNIYDLSNNNHTVRDLLQRESDSLEVIEIHKESMINLDTSFDDNTVFETSDDIHDLNKRGTSSTIDTIAENEYLIKSDEPIRIKIHNYNPNMKVINSEKFKIVGKDTIYEQESYIHDISQPRELTKEEKERMKKRGTKVYHIESVSSVTINNVTMQDSNIVDIKDSKQNIKTEIEVDEGENNQEFTLKPGQKVWGDEDTDSNNSSSKLYSNMSFDFLEYNINELIPIQISFDGVNTDFIVWYEATDDFLKRLPTNILEKINPELVALYEQSAHCENEPIEKKDAVMDVWSGCSGAIKEMKVFPNPATSNSNVEFELEDSRAISISIYDLSGKLIKNVKTGLSLSKGNTSESLNLTGVNPGLYYVVVKSEKGEQALQRIIIE
ncbi:MAG: T9SS type A sorting domain-containing protein [Candidatus Kapaibacterium sp.]